MLFKVTFNTLQFFCRVFINLNLTLGQPKGLLDSTSPHMEVQPGFCTVMH